MTREVQILLKWCNITFRSGEKSLYRMRLRTSIKSAKKAYKRRVENHHTDSYPQRMWQGIHHITNHKGSTNTITDANTLLAVELNRFFTWFEVKLPATDSLPPPAANNHTLSQQEHQVRHVLRSVNPRKAASPNGVLSRVLHACADQLTEVFMKIFNISLSKCTIPPCLKSAAIIPIPKKTVTEDLNNYNNKIGSTYTCKHEVLWATGSSSHQRQSASHLWSSSISLPCQQEMPST